MQRSLRTDLGKSDRFVVTVELVLAPEADGDAIKTARAIAEDARKDGRVSAVSITDNPGGNPSLSPDVLAGEIVESGMDVLVHVACRDLNRMALESRILQLGRLGVKNLLSLTGDFPATGFSGKGAPVFDLDSVTLLGLMRDVNARLHPEDPDDGFYIGSGVSPFKATESETHIQYAKLRLKTAMGARFIITQLGYDARKYQELIQVQKELNIQVPTMASIYFLMRGAARVMNAGKVPGVVVPDALLQRIENEFKHKETRRAKAIERTARLAAICKGLGYRGVHIGGMHKSFATVDEIITRMDEIGDDWKEYLPDYDLPMDNGYYMFGRNGGVLSGESLTPRSERCSGLERVRHASMRAVHHALFRFDSPLTPVCKSVAKFMDKTPVTRECVKLPEDLSKKVLFGCKSCGDCGLQHVGFLCPESQCPKHQRNGACGGSDKGQCEVYPEKPCVWVRAYRRLAAAGKSHEIATEIVPPRMWSLNDTSSWLNFHLKRDHQSLSEEELAPFRPPELEEGNG